MQEERQPLLRQPAPRAIDDLTFNTIALAFFVSIAYLSALLYFAPRPFVMHTSLSDLKTYAYSDSAGSFGPKHLAIYDPSALTASYAIAVSSGSFSDPEDVPGLAHFAEHMLFLGNERFPSATDYDDFVTSHGGRSNAFTDSDKTVFYTYLSAEGFGEGLDRMLNFFARPKFDPEAVAGEMHAVDSEHAIHHSDPVWRILSAVGSLENSPLNKFTTGNFATLNRSDIVDRLQTYFDENFCPHRMALVTYGPFSVNEQLAFTKMLMTGLELVTPSSCGFANDWSHQVVLNHSSFIHISAPSNAKPQVWVGFPMRALSKFYQSKPLAYLETVIAQAGKGGLRDFLVSSNYATRMEFFSDDSPAGSMLYIVAYLTSLGKSDYLKVVGIINSFLDQLRAEGVSLPLYEDLQSIRNSTFQAEDPFAGAPADLVKKAAAALIDGIPPSSVLESDFLINDIRTDIVTEILDNMTIDRAVVVMYDPGWTGSDSFLWNEYYEFNYTVSALNVTSILGHSFQTLREIELLPPAISSVFKPVNLDWSVVGSPPMLIAADNGYEIWLRESALAPDVPQASIFASIALPAPLLDVASEGWGALLKRCVDTSMYSKSSQLVIAGNSYEFEWNRNGFEMIVNGWSDHVSVLNDLLMKVVANADCVDDFESIKAALRSDLQLVGVDRLSALNSEAVDALTALTPTSKDVLAWMSSPGVDYAGLLNWLKDSLAGGYLTVFGGGLISEDALTESAQTIIDAFGGQGQFGNLTEINFWYAGPSYTQPVEVRDRSPIADTTNTGILVSFLLPPDSPFEYRAAMALLGQMLDADAFQYLRTSKQLGYVAFASTGVFPAPAGSLQLRIGVQGNNVSPDEMDVRIEELIQMFSISNITDSDLETWISAQVESLSQLPSSKSSEIRRFWPIIRDHTDCFTRREQQIAYLIGRGADVIKKDIEKVFNRLTGSKRVKVTSKLFVWDQNDASIPTQSSLALKEYDKDAMQRWLSAEAGTFLTSDSARFDVDQALLHATDQHKVNYDPSLPDCLTDAELTESIILVSGRQVAQKLFKKDAMFVI